jgi:hypothetical protein
MLYAWSLPFLSSTEKLSLCRHPIARNVITHVLTEHLCGGFALGATGFDEFLAQITLDSKA